MSSNQAAMASFVDIMSNMFSSSNAKIGGGVQVAEHQASVGNPFDMSYDLHTMVNNPNLSKNPATQHHREYLQSFFYETKRKTTATAFNAEGAGETAPTKEAAPAQGAEPAAQGAEKKAATAVPAAQQPASAQGTTETAAAQGTTETAAAQGTAPAAEGKTTETVVPNCIKDDGSPANTTPCKCADKTCEAPKSHCAVAEGKGTCSEPAPAAGGSS